MQNFGRTLLFVVAIMLLIAGTKMAVKIVDPYTRKVSTSLADALAAV